MTKAILTSLNLNQNEIQNAVEQNLAVRPSNPKEGQHFWNTATKKWEIFNGTEWVHTGYKLPIATNEQLGGIKSSSSISIDSFTGIATVINNSHNHTSSNISDFNDAVNTEMAKAFVNVDYSASDGILTFTQKDGSTLPIDLPLELLIESGYYDAEKREIVLVLANKQEIRIPASGLVDEYYGDETTINLKTVDGKLIFSVKPDVFEKKLTFDDSPTENSSNPVTSKGILTSLNTKANISSLSKVATSGSYTDLINKPDLKPVATSGSYTDLINKPTILTKVISINPILTSSGGVCNWNISHNLGDDVVVNVKQISNGEDVICDILQSSNKINIKINSSTDIEAGKYKVVLVG